MCSPISWTVQILGWFRGRAPEEVIRELYPNDDDVAVALRRVQTPKVLSLLGSLVSARWKKMVLLSRLSAIIADERTNSDLDWCEAHQQPRSSGILLENLKSSHCGPREGYDFI